MSTESSELNRYVWPVRLAAGVSKGNLFTLYYAAFVTVGMLAVLNFLQPYILIENLRVPEGEEGALTGMLSFVAESMMICFGFFVGAWSDRIGRNILYAAGFVTMAIGYAAYGNVDSVGQLFVVRGVLAVGAVLIGVMFTSVQTDYPDEADRGKLLGIAALITALGVTVAVVAGGQLPNFFQGRGSAPVPAGARTMYVICAVAGVSALIVRLGLKRGRSSMVNQGLPFGQVIREGLGAARNNRIVLCYLTAFVSRADMTVVGLFFSLWLTTTGVEQGMTTADALAKATLFFGLFNIASLFWAPVMGVIIDRLDRVRALVIGLALAAAGYGGLCIVDDPMNNPLFYGWLVLLGIGVISPVLAAQALLGQETLPELRGSVNGIFAAAGAVGILSISVIGGYLFDVWKPYPFLVVAILNVLLLGATFWLNRR
jgi:MFS family permease